MILLIHGAWHGAWAWQNVIARLTEHHGRTREDITAPDLPGCGADSHNLNPDISLEDHVMAAMPDEPAIICAHSYGGVVARQIASRHPERVLRLVLIEALWPIEGQCAFDLLPDATRTAFTDAIATSGDGWRMPPPDAGHFDLPDPALAANINRRMSDHPARTFMDRVTGAEPELKGDYIIATDRPARPYDDTAERLAASGWEIITTDGGHELPLTKPDVIARMLCK